MKCNKCGYDWSNSGDSAHVCWPVKVMQQEQGESVVGTKTWFEDGKVVTQNLYFNDVYTSSPAEQKPWVGLTEEDFVCVHQLCDTPIQAAEYVDRLLKEKNT